MDDIDWWAVFKCIVIPSDIVIFLILLGVNKYWVDLLANTICLLGLIGIIGIPKTSNI